MMLIKAIALWLMVGAIYQLIVELLVQKHYAHRGGRETFEREANGQVMPTATRWKMYGMVVITWPWWVGREIRFWFQRQG